MEWVGEALPKQGGIELCNVNYVWSEVHEKQLSFHEGCYYTWYCYLMWEEKRLTYVTVDKRGVDIPHRESCSRSAYKYGSRSTGKIIPFSAFWLRSSVVSVLISLISDTWPIRPHDINLISFMGAAPVRGSLLSLGAACVALVLH